MKIYPGDVERLVEYLDREGAPKRAGKTVLSLEGRVSALLEAAQHPLNSELANACPNCQGVNGYKLQDGTIYNCPACGQPEASQSG